MHDHISGIEASLLILPFRAGFFFAGVVLAVELETFLDADDLRTGPALFTGVSREALTTERDVQNLLAVSLRWRDTNE